MDFYGFLWISMDFSSIQAMILDCFISMMSYDFVPQFLMRAVFLDFVPIIPRVANRATHGWPTKSC